MMGWKKIESNEAVVWQKESKEEELNALNELCAARLLYIILRYRYLHIC